MKSVSGIYAIENIVTGDCYIGSSANLSRRCQLHFAGLRRGNHINPHLQAAWNKYGKEVFLFTVLMRCTVADLLTWEQAFLDEWKPEYNINLIAAIPPSHKGTHLSVEHRAKITATSMGKIRSDETIQKIAETLNGHPVLIETRRRMSKTRKGKKLGPQSDRHRQKISFAMMGNKHWSNSRETRRKMSISQKIRREKEQHKQTLVKFKGD